MKTFEQYLTEQIDFKTFSSVIDRMKQINPGWTDLNITWNGKMAKVGLGPQQHSQIDLAPLYKPGMSVDALANLAVAEMGKAGSANYQKPDYQAANTQYAADKLNPNNPAWGQYD